MNDESGAMSLDCVVDASVGIKLFLVEPLADRADGLFASLAVTPPARLYVPDLFYVECTNILLDYVRRFGYSPEAARQDVADLAEASLALALEHGATAHDAAYVALAQELSLLLVTADEALCRRMDGTGLDVRWLGEWPA